MLVVMWVVAGLLCLVLAGGFARRRGNRLVELAELRAENLALSKALAEVSTERRRWLRQAEDRIEKEINACAEELREAQDALEREKLRLRGLAHDLRNPLVAVQFASHELVARQSTDVLQRRVEDQLAALERCNALVVEMVESMSAEQGTEVPPAVADLSLVELEDFLEARLESLGGIRGDWEIIWGAQLPEGLRVCQGALQRVLDNLLVNAFEHAGGHGIRIRMDASPDRHVVIRVSDQGPGIPTALVQRMLSGGLLEGGGRQGLGLALVVDAIQELGGWLELHTNGEDGTTYWVHVPMAPEWARPRVRRVVLRGRASKWPSLDAVGIPRPNPKVYGS